jgi:hypothetical protein
MSRSAQSLPARQQFFTTAMWLSAGAGLPERL